MKHCKITIHMHFLNGERIQSTGYAPLDDVKGCISARILELREPAQAEIDAAPKLPKRLDVEALLTLPDRGGSLRSERPCTMETLARTAADIAAELDARAQEALGRRVEEPPATVDPFAAIRQTVAHVRAIDSIARTTTAVASGRGAEEALKSLISHPAVHEALSDSEGAAGLVGSAAEMLKDPEARAGMAALIKDLRLDGLLGSALAPVKKAEGKE